MNRLVTFGCSHTFGQALPDVWDSEKRKHLFHNGASKYAWPQILANKLNIECANQGKPGASVKEIWYRIVNFDFQKEDIVIVLYTIEPRSCLIFSDQISDHDIVSNKKDWRLFCDYFPEPNIKSKEKILPISSGEEHTIADRYFKFIYDPYDYIMDIYMRINYIDMFLKNKINKLLHYSTKDVTEITSIPLSIRKQIEVKWHKTKINSSAFYRMRSEEYLKNYEVALDGLHPGIKGHEAFAIIVYEELC